MILVPFIPRDLRFVNGKPFGKLARRESPSDPRCDEHAAETVQVHHLAEIAALQSLVALHFLVELEMK